MRRDHCAPDAHVIGQLVRTRFLQVRTGNGEGALQGIDMAGQNEARGKRHSQPFMRIESDGIGLLNSPYEIAVLVREKDCRAVSSIDVEPDIIATTYFMNRKYVIDRARTGRARRRYYTKRFCDC